MTELPVVLGSAVSTAAARRGSASRGHRLVALREVPDEPWDLGEAQVVAGGVLRTREDVAQAVHVVSRGGGLIAELELDPVSTALLFEDLRRLRPDLAFSDPSAELTETERALIGLLAEGSTVTSAAKTLFISRRTADRHLAHLRTIAGVDSNQQAVLWFTSRALRR